MVREIPCVSTFPRFRFGAVDVAVSFQLMQETSPGCWEPCCCAGSLSPLGTGTSTSFVIPAGPQTSLPAAWRTPAALWEPCAGAASVGCSPPSPCSALSPGSLQPCAVLRRFPMPEADGSKLPGDTRARSGDTALLWELLSPCGPTVLSPAVCPQGSVLLNPCPRVQEQAQP